MFDKSDAAQERYHYINTPDNKVQITHGPFNQDGTLFWNAEPDDFYYSKNSD